MIQTNTKEQVLESERATKLCGYANPIKGDAMATAQHQETEDNVSALEGEEE